MRWCGLAARSKHISPPASAALRRSSVSGIDTPKPVSRFRRGSRALTRARSAENSVLEGRTTCLTQPRAGSSARDPAPKLALVCLECARRRLVTRLAIRSGEFYSFVGSAASRCSAVAGPSTKSQHVLQTAVSQAISGHRQCDSCQSHFHPAVH